MALITGLLLRPGLYAQEFPQDWANYARMLDQSGTLQSGGGVNEFTGTVNYSLNFHTLLKSFPVSIGYQSGGIKVDEYASAVGLGWNLDAGGSITKITRGLDDLEPTKGYHNSMSQLRTPENVYNGVIDGEKDYYVFSAFGRSGTFYYDETTTSYKPLSGEKISIDWNPSPGTFTIRDDAGNAYHFTSRETIYTYSQSMSNLVNTQYGNWFLTKVVLADKQEINLAYQAKTITGLKVAFSEVSAIKYGSCTALPNHIGRFIYNTYQSYRVQSITSGNTTVNFVYNSTARQDIADDYALQEVNVQLNGEPVKRYRLVQGYASGRLMLEKVLDRNVTTGSDLELAVFEYYNDYTMPLPASVQSQDWMGYFNGQPAYTTTYYTPNFKTLVAPYQTPGTIGSAGIQPGANRSIAAAEVTQTLMLKKVTDLYGKIEEFAYEPNTYKRIENVYGGPGPTAAEVTAHGLRVARVTSYELTQPEKKRFTGYSYTDNGASTGLMMAVLDSPMIYESGCTRIIRMPNARKTRIQAVDAPVVYTSVKTQVYTDENNITASTLGYHINTYTVDTPGYVDETSGSNSYRVFHANRYLWGKPLISSSYNTSMEMVDRVTYTYEHAISKSYRSVFVWLGRKLPGGVNDAAGNFYYTSVGYHRLKSVTSQRYNTTAQLLLTSKKELTYDSRGYVTETKSYVNNVLKNRTSYKRAYNYTLTGPLNDLNGLGIWEMNERGITAPVIERISYKVAGGSETVVDAAISLPKYDQQWQIVLPDKELAYKQVTPQTSVTALSFNGSGTPVYPSAYMTASQATLFDDRHQPCEVISAGVAYTALHHNDNGNLLCSFSDAPFNSTGYLGFEPYEMARVTGSLVSGNWMVWDAQAVTTNAFTGKAAIDLSAYNGPMLTFKHQLQQDKKYLVRYWKKQGSGSVSLLADYVPSTEPGTVLRTENGWDLVEHTFTGATYALLQGTATVDDVLIYPLGASYQYSVYDQKEQLTETADASGTIVKYDYDHYGRTRHVKDVSGNVLKAYEYGIKEQQ